VDPRLDYLPYLTTESARFATVIARTAPDTRVPSCPDWSAEDLLWHLSEVQWFWGTVVREHLTGDQAEALKPPRPDSWAGLLSFYDRASRDLAQALAANPPESVCWNWSTDHTVGFIRRRQAHEALIHRLDAELAANDRTPLDRLLSTDGVGEALAVMYGGLPDWGTFTPGTAGTLRLRATDTGETWFVRLGRFTGTDPDDGNSYDEPDIQLADHDPGTRASAEVAGSAADLDCWLWHRPPLLPVQRSGDQGALSHFDSAVAPGIN
jgi:uncharacterized protein (TIGR03083 family)